MKTQPTKVIVFDEIDGHPARLDVGELLKRRVVVTINGKEVISANVWQLLLHAEMTGKADLVRLEIS